MNRLQEAMRALTIAPLARADERDQMLRRLDVQAGETVVDLVAWDGYLTDAIRKDATVIEVNVARRSSRTIQAMPEGVSLAAGIADAVAIMTGLHHRPSRPAVFAEARRLLKPGGRIVIAEVLAGSAVARFLDLIPGHRGIYPTSLAGELAAAGFMGVTEETVPCEWRFESIEQARDYVQAMFGADGSAAIAKCWGDALAWPWPLLFASGDVTP